MDENGSGENTQIVKLVTTKWRDRVESILMGSHSSRSREHHQQEIHEGSCFCRQDIASFLDIQTLHITGPQDKFGIRFVTFENIILYINVLNEM